MCHCAALNRPDGQNGALLNERRGDGALQNPECEPYQPCLHVSTVQTLSRHAHGRRPAAPSTESVIHFFCLYDVLYNKAKSQQLRAMGEKRAVLFTLAQIGTADHQLQYLVQDNVSELLRPSDIFRYTRLAQPYNSQSAAKIGDPDARKMVKLFLLHERT